MGRIVRRELLHYFMIPRKNSTSSKIRIRMMTSSSKWPRDIGDLLDGEAVDVVERIKLVLDVLLPAVETEARRGELEDPRGVDVADHLERVLRLVGQLVDVDEQRVQLLRGADVARPARLFHQRGSCSLS